MKRKTSITKIASILTVLAMVWGGVACQPEAPVEPTKYTISFDSGVESITVEDGAVATEPTKAPEKTGYTFGGWLKGEAAYDWTQPVTSNLYLTAKWTAVEYTITYLPEGVETDNPPTYTIETETIVLDTNPTSPDATKPKFVAWHVDSEEGDVVTEIAKGSTGNKTFYAEFSAEEPCVVKFMLGTTEEVASTNVKKGAKITLPNGFEKYSLFSDADCTTAFDTTTAITADTTIYVKLKTFTISYKVLPFNEEDSLPNIPYGKVFTDEEINAFAEEIDGYTYKGVFTDEECTLPFDNTKAITSDLTVYVLYEEVPCVVKFMLGTEVVTSINVKKDTKITLPTDFEKYSLFSDADCTKAFDTNTAITADTTIYVKLKTFTISYKVLPFNEEDSLPNIPYGKVFTDEEINAFAEEIDGYTYKGVFTDEACTVPFDNTNAITSDLTVYVLYEESINPVLWEGETTLAWTDEGKINFETPDWISANQWVLISYELTTENAGTIQICITDPWTQFAGGAMSANGKILFQYTEDSLGKTICLQGEKATVTKVEVLQECKIPNGATVELYDMSYKLDGDTFSAVSWKEGSYSKEYIISDWTRYPVVNCDDWESITIDYEVPAGCTGVQLGINGGYNSSDPDETKAKYVVADDWSCKGSATLQLNSDELVGRTFPYIFVILYMDSDAPTGTFTINDIYFTPKAE